MLRSNTIPMKKLFTMIFGLILMTQVQAQFKVGVEGGYSNTWLINRNLSDAGDRVDPLASFAPSFGVQFTYLFNEAVGIRVGANMSTYLQKTDGELAGFSFESEMKLNQLDIPLLFRLENDGGTYFEVGPMFSFLSSAEETYTPNTGGGYSDMAFDDDFSSTNISAYAGFGILVDLNDNIQMTAGLALSYGFTDATTEYEENNLPDFENWSNFNQIAHFEQNLDFGYESTAQAAAGIKIGFVYVIRGSTN